MFIKAAHYCFLLGFVTFDIAIKCILLFIKQMQQMSPSTVRLFWYFYSRLYLLYPYFICSLPRSISFSTTGKVCLVVLRVFCCRLMAEIAWKSRVFYLPCLITETFWKSFSCLKFSSSTKFKY